jgi:CBS domain-containing protein/ribosome-associated translation inhibitor RaiA
MRLEEIMTSRVVTIDPDETARVAWSRMRRERIRHLVVLDRGRLVGVLSERDLGGPGGAQLRRGRLVRELMTRQVASAKPGTTLRQAANLMRGRLIGSLPVVEDGRVVGIVTATDVLEELGRGSTRPAVTAKRRGMRLAPVGARSAAKRKRERSKRETKARGKRDTEPVPAQAPPTGRITPALGRDRLRVPDSSRRAPMAAEVVRPTKLEANRAGTESIPAFIRSFSNDADEGDREYMRRKLGRKLGKFGRFIERASVRIEDVNGPRGGIDKRCRIKVVLKGLPSVVVEQQHEALQAAMDGALERTERAVRRSVQRRRTRRPVRRAASPA